ncbi:MAG: Trk system potassium transporter TrkA [Planctomycetota bacterium]|jgi:trk system potassium uptake protein TrkA
MRILIGGEDEIAFRLAEALMADHEVALLCPESARSARLDKLDVEISHGPITSTDALRHAGVADSDIFVACSSVDENNLVACVTAKHLGAKASVCFLFRVDLLMQSEDRRTLAESLGIDTVILPAEQLADEITRIVLVPGALDVEVFLGGRVRLLQYSLEEGAPITKEPLKHLGLPTGVVLVMARRDDAMFIPKGDTHFRAGDKVTAMGSLAGINRLVYGHLRAGKKAEDNRRATIVGGGSVGLSVARGLERAHWDVKVVESDKKRCEDISVSLKGLVLHGDGTDLDLLESERVGDDSVLVAVTSNDEKNLLVSLLGKQLGVRRILTRVDQQTNERLFERVGIDVVLSARGATPSSRASATARPISSPKSSMATPK